MSKFSKDVTELMQTIDDDDELQTEVANAVAKVSEVADLLLYLIDRHAAKNFNPEDIKAVTKEMKQHVEIHWGNEVCNKDRNEHRLLAFALEWIKEKRDDLTYLGKPKNQRPEGYREGKKGRGYRY